MKDIYLRDADRFGWGPSCGMENNRIQALKKFVVGPKIIDIGCAAGQYVDYLSKQGFEATGVDFVKEFIDLAGQLGRRGNFVHADATALPFPDKYFDTAVMFAVLEHVENDEAALREVVRVTKQRIIALVPLAEPEGFAGHGVLFHHHIDKTHTRCYRKDDLWRLFEGLGCEVLHYEEIFPVDVTSLFLSSVSPRFVRGALRLILRFLQKFGIVRFKRYFSEAILVAEIKGDE